MISLYYDNDIQSVAHPSCGGPPPVDSPYEIQSKTVLVFPSCLLSTL